MHLQLVQSLLQSLQPLSIVLKQTVQLIPWTYCVD